MKIDLFFKSKRYLEWAISFWVGVGLMSIIDVIKIVYDQNAPNYEPPAAQPAAEQRDV